MKTRVLGRNLEVSALKFGFDIDPPGSATG
jgi:hypothetical protein